MMMTLMDYYESGGICKVDGQCKSVMGDACRSDLDLDICHVILGLYVLVRMTLSPYERVSLYLAVSVRHGKFLDSLASRFQRFANDYGKSS